MQERQRTSQAGAQDAGFLDDKVKAEKSIRIG